MNRFNKAFFKDTPLLILKERISSTIDNGLPERLVVKIGTPREVLLPIMNSTLFHQEFFSKIIIVSDKNLCNLETVNTLLDKLDSFDIDMNTMYFLSVHHSGINDQCKVDDRVIICNQWHLPLLGNNYRSNTSLYGDCVSHRIKMKSIPMLIYKSFY